MAIISLIIDGELLPVVLRVVLDERINHVGIGLENGNHVGFGDDDLPVQDVVVGVVAAVDDKGEVDHEARGIALAVGAGIGKVGRQAVVGEEFVLALAVNDDASARAFHLRGKVDPTADSVQLVILHRVGINREAKRRGRPIGVFGIFLTAVQQRQDGH